jgi:hypothetical protein
MLKEFNIESFTNAPKKIELAFVCVYHDEIKIYLERFNGIVYDFRKLNKTL